MKNKILTPIENIENELIVGLKWRANNRGGASYDLDLSAIINTNINDSHEYIYYNKIESNNKSIILNGDNSIGSTFIENNNISMINEYIKIDLSKLNPLDEVIFIVSIYNKDKNFEGISDSSVLLYDIANEKIILSYKLERDFSKSKLLEFCRLFQKNGKWVFELLGVGHKITTLSIINRYFGEDMRDEILLDKDKNSVTPKFMPIHIEKTVPTPKTMEPIKVKIDSEPKVKIPVKIKIDSELKAKESDKVNTNIIQEEPKPISTNTSKKEISLDPEKVKIVKEELLEEISPVSVAKKPSVVAEKKPHSGVNKASVMCTHKKIKNFSEIDLNCIVLNGQGEMIDHIYTSKFTRRALGSYPMGKESNTNKSLIHQNKDLMNGYYSDTIDVELYNLDNSAEKVIFFILSNSRDFISNYLISDSIKITENINMPISKEPLKFISDINPDDFVNSGSILVGEFYKENNVWRFSNKLASLEEKSISEILDKLLLLYK